MKKPVLLVFMNAVLLTSFSLCADTTEEKEEISPPAFRRPIISPVAFDEVVHALQMGPQARVTIGDDEYAVLDSLPRLKFGFELFKKEQIRSLPNAGSGIKWICAGVGHVEANDISYITIRFIQEGNWHQEYNGNTVTPIRTANFMLKKI